MRDHQAEGNCGRSRKARLRGGVSVEQDIFRKRAGHFRADGGGNSITFSLRSALTLAGLD